MFELVESGSAPRRPRPWLALLLSFVLAGLGYFYARRPGLAALTTVALPPIPFLLVRAGLLRTRAGAVCLVVGFVGLQIGIAVHAAYGCRHTLAASFGWPRAALRYGLFVTLAFASLLVTATVGVRFAANGCVHLAAVRGDSMAPTLSDGDRFVWDSCQHEPPPVGELVVFDKPTDPSTMQVKRVAGRAGDIVDGATGVIHVNGRPWARAVAPSYVATPQLFGPVTVHRDALFLLGDNLDNSQDSRHFGPVPVALVRGTALYVLMSTNGTAGRSLTSTAP